MQLECLAGTTGWAPVVRRVPTLPPKSGYHRGEPPGYPECMTGAGPHEYTSTARLHSQCGSCRNTCKYCGTSCRHGCHPRHGSLPAAGVDQARGVARELLAAVGADTARMPRELVQRIREDPALFWLRGGERPPGTWEAP